LFIPPRHLEKNSLTCSFLQGTWKEQADLFIPPRHGGKEQADLFIPPRHGGKEQADLFIPPRHLEKNKLTCSFLQGTWKRTGQEEGLAPAARG